MSIKISRGSVVFQVDTLFELIKEFGVAKHEAKGEFYRIAQELGLSGTTSNFSERNGVFGHATADKIRQIWREGFQFAKDNYSLKLITLMNGKAISGFLNNVMDRNEQKNGFVNGNTIGVYTSALIKMAVALDRLHGYDVDNPGRIADIRAGNDVQEKYQTYVDIFRTAIADATDDREIIRPGQDRAYSAPYALREHISNDKHQLAARLMHEELGARISEVSLIRPYQLGEDNRLSYISKGGQLNDRYISQESGDCLRGYFARDGEFRFNQNSFRDDLKQAAAKSNQSYAGKGSHGLRWCYAREKYEVYKQSGMTENQALKQVSEDLSHHRIEITLHYLGR